MRFISPPITLTLITLCILAGYRPAFANEPGAEANRERQAALCPPGFVPPLPPPVVSSDNNVHVDADAAKIESGNITTFSGDVNIRQGGKRLQADQIRYDRTTELFTASGQVIYSDTTWQLRGKDAQFNLNNTTGTIKQADYLNILRLARGQAETLELESRDRLRMDVANYTSCPEEDVAWLLSATKITLDQQTQQGSAENVSLRFMDVPILYFPYLRFPIGDQRLSGFLYPGIGTSQQHGNEFNLPFYWNIAPQYDATINPHYMSKRGWMLENEFRYLTEKNSGYLDLNVLPNDKLYGDRRDRITWNHTGQLAPNWSTIVTYNEVSDVEYISDFSNSLAFSSITHLDRRGQLQYNSPRIGYTLVAQDYQTITGTEPYKRLPQMNLNTRLTGQDNTVNYELYAELVRFDHLDQNKVIGERLHLNPVLSYPWRAAAGYFAPKISLYQINYALGHIDPATRNESPSVTVPVYSLDAGLYMERNLQLGNTAYLHTLEPRLYYLYAPYKDQSELPIFDTGLTTFNDVTMFSENRFSGGDRVGDADQLAAAVSSHIYRDDTGYEVMSATLGELFYFKERQVTLLSQNIDNQTRSSLFGSLAISPSAAWLLRGDVQWNTDSGHTEVGNTRVQYRPAADSVINFDYRFRRNELRTIGGSAAWRFNPRWRAFGGHQFDIQNNHKLENFLGLHYESCCWGLRLLATERFDVLNSTVGNPLYEQAVYLSLELKGLSNFGQQNEMRTLLEGGIYGFTP